MVNMPTWKTVSVLRRRWVDVVGFITTTPKKNPESVIQGFLLFDFQHLSVYLSLDSTGARSGKPDASQFSISSKIVAPAFTSNSDETSI